MPCANQAATQGEKERGREEDRHGHGGKGGSKIEADGVGRGRKM